MKNIFLITALSLLIISCKEVKNSTSEKTESISKKESVKVENDDIIFHQNDTIIKFQKVEGTYGIFKWGVDSKFENIGKDTLSYDSSKFGKLKKIDDKFIFTDGCGTACDFALVSVFKPEDKGVILMYPLLVDQKNNIIVYKGDEENILASIYYLKTGKTEDIIEGFDNTIRPPKNVIENLSINDDGNLVLEWINDNSKKNKKTFILSEE